MKLLCHILIVSLLCLVGSALQAEGVRITRQTLMHELNRDITYLIDQEGQLTLDQIRSPTLQSQFKPMPDTGPAFGYTHATYWFKLTLLNATDTTDWLISLDLPALDYIDFYAPAQHPGQPYLHQQSGDRLPFFERPLATRDHVFPITVPNNQPITLYWRVNTSSSMTVPAVLWAPSSYARNSESAHLFYGLYFGFLFALAAYNLVLYLSRIHISYLFYVVSVVGIGLWQLTHSGLAFRYLWPDALYLQHVAVNLFAAGGMAGLGLFTLYFLKVKVIAHRLHAALWLIVIACTLSMLAAAGNVVDQVLLSRINTLLALTNAVLCIAAGIICWRRGQHIARFLVFSQCVWLSALLITALRAAGLVNVEFLSLYATHLSIPIETLLLAIALSDRYRQMHHQREAAKELALHTLRSTERMLEQRVEERTEALLQTNKKLEEANQELDRLNHEKTELLRIAAHDLKNPVSQLRAASDLLRQKIAYWPLNKSVAMLGNMHQSAVRMTDIITKLLDLDAIESGKLSVNAVRVDWCESVRNVLDEVGEWAASKQIQLQPELPPQADIWADAELVYQIDENLISNAIKFSPPGSVITIKLSCNAEVAKLEVEDQGPGIREDDMSQLFRSFAKLSARPTGGEHSTGLGLSIVKRLTTSMSGQVWYEQPTQGGARFCVTLPLPSHPQPEPAAQPS
nr:sensor histidine kinase [Chitinivorax tropicus]